MEVNVIFSSSILRKLSSSVLTLLMTFLFSARSEASLTPLPADSSEVSTTSQARYRVVDDVYLNVRDGASVGHQVIGVIPPAATGVTIDDCVGHWCNIVWRRVSGWANIRFLRPEETAHKAQITIKTGLTDTNSTSGTDDVAIKWLGGAASPNRVFEVTNRKNEVEANNAAISVCEQASGRTCTAIAVPMSWDVVVLSCKHPGQAPVSIVSGSGQGLAIDVARAKAYAAGFRPSNCGRERFKVVGK
jgi:uncharacterized protein YraI